MVQYPLKFEPILKQKIWGGTKLVKLLNKKSNATNIGESWEISGVEDNISIVSNGVYQGTSLNELIKIFKSELLGAKNLKRFGENFPLLIKFLDAKTHLSIQVHPDDEMANLHHNSFGKTEMWYIIDSDESSEIILGLNKKTESEKELKINSDNVYDIYNAVEVKKGDSFFIPAGKVHAIGAGILLAEIQQTSDVTYRIYDWDRTDDKGVERELHTELAKKATKTFDSNKSINYELESGKTTNLVSCKFFTTNIFEVKTEFNKDYSNLDSFVILMCVEGTALITIENYTETINLGETVLIPANVTNLKLKSECAKLLEVYIN